MRGFFYYRIFNSLCKKFLTIYNSCLSIIEILTAKQSESKSRVCLRDIKHRTPKINKPLKYVFKSYHRNITDKELICDLKKAAKKLGKNYLTINEYSKAGSFDPTTPANRFGGWNSAIVKAGLKVKKPGRIPDIELMMNLKKVWDSLGRQPKMCDLIKPLSLYGTTVYTNRYGSWLKALKIFVRFANSRKLIPVNIVNSEQKRKKVKRLSRKISIGMRYEVFKRDKYKCRICGATPARDPNVTLHADHIIPRSKGGETILNNLQTLCSRCNLGKGAKTNNKEQKAESPLSFKGSKRKEIIKNLRHEFH